MTKKRIAPKDLGLSDNKELLYKVKALTEAGNGKLKIAKELNLSIAAVCKLLEETASLKEPIKVEDNTYKRVVALLEKGKNVVEISKELDITLNSALYWVSRVENGGKPSLVDEIRKSLDEDSFETYDLAKRYTKTPAAINRLIRKAEMDFNPAADWIRRAAKSGILYSRLQRELKIKSLDRAKEVLQESFKDCFIVVTPYNDDYILTPVHSSKEDVEWINIDNSNRKFSYYVAPEGNYLTVKFDESIPKDKIKIVFLSDIHVGSKYYRKELFKSFIDRIKADPYTFVIINGDLIECNFKMTAGSAMEQYSSINEQVEEFIQTISPIADRVLCSTLGNHEQRIERHTEFDLGRLVANIIKVPYFNVMVYIDLFFKDQKYTLAVTHYWSKGLFGQAQIVAKVKQIASTSFFPVNLYCGGHTHSCFVQPEYGSVLVPGRGKQPFEYIVANSGSFTQHTGSYSEKAGYAWSPQGVIYFTIDSQGQMEVFQHKIQPI